MRAALIDILGAAALGALWGAMFALAI